MQDVVHAPPLLQGNQHLARLDHKHFRLQPSQHQRLCEKHAGMQPGTAAGRPRPRTSCHWSATSCVVPLVCLPCKCAMTMVGPERSFCSRTSSCPPLQKANTPERCELAGRVISVGQAHAQCGNVPLKRSSALIQLLCQQHVFRLQLLGLIASLPVFVPREIATKLAFEAYLA